MAQSAVSLNPNISRPKIHRPPALPPAPAKNQLVSVVLSYGDTAKTVFALSTLALGVILAALLLSRFLPNDMMRQEVVAKTESDIVPSALTSQPVGKTIVLKDENDVIIGQMAKINSPSMQPDEIKAISPEVDKTKGKELLSIISKY